MRTRLLALVAFMLGFAALAQTSTNELTDLLQKGLFDEEANRDLTSAISDYQTLASHFDKDRELAATAIFRLGECYRKLGRTNDAVVQYQRIVRDFSDQPTLVNLSRQNLAGLNASQNSAATQPNPANSEPARELSWVKKLQAMPLSEVRQVAPTVLTDATLINLIYQYNQTELDLIRLRTDHGPEHPEVQKTQAIQAALQDKIKERLDGMSRALSMELGVSTNGPSGGYGAQNSAVTDEEEQRIREIQAMIQNSPDLINAQAPGGGYTPLQSAAQKGQLVVAKYLLDHGADVDGKGPHSNETPLFMAADNGHKAMVELLLSRGADVNGGGLNPLDRAISKNFKEVVDVLLAHKANVNALNERGNCALYIAVSSGNTEFIQPLLDHGADVDLTNSSGETALYLAAGQGDVAAAKILLHAKANIEARNKGGQTPLAIAAQSGSAKAVSFLLNSGGSVDATNVVSGTPLLSAAWGGYADVAQELLKHHADPNHSDTNGNTPLMAVLQGNHYSVDLVRGLLEHKADPNYQSPRSPTPLWAAIDKNEADAVELLLQYGADPNGPPGAFESPLNEALDHGANHRIIGPLLDKGADPNARNQQGEVPLARTSDPEIIRELVAHKADVNARSRQGGWTPLMSWTQNSAEGLKALLAGGANPDLQNDGGDTALHLAVTWGRTNFVTILLENKANPNIQNNAGDTPLDLAKRILSPPQQGMGGQPVFFSPGHQVSVEAANFMVAALTEAGGLANLPKRDRIEVRRASSSYEMDAFFKGTNDWNRFSLLETIAEAYGLLGQDTAGEWRPTRLITRSQSFNSSLPFPDFKNVVIYRRVGNSAKQTAINVDVESILNSGDCSRDVWLQWGDVVEIPETDHPVEEQWPGLSDTNVDALIKCVARQVTVKIKGESTTLKLSPEFSAALNGPGGSMRTLVRADFMLRSVLDNSKLIRVSSDLAHVKVTREDTQTHKTMNWTVDCNNPKEDNLWLREGDVIEVPER